MVGLTLTLDQGQFFYLWDQGHCGSCWKKWGVAATDVCPCGEHQTMSHIVNSCPQTKLEGGWAAAIALSWMTELLKLKIWEQFVIIYFFLNVITILMLSVVCTFGLPDVDEHAISNNDLASAQQRHTQTVHKAMVRWDRMRTHHSTWSDVPTAEFIKQLKQKITVFFKDVSCVIKDQRYWRETKYKPYHKAHCNK